MTLVLGLRCRDGVVLASDSQRTEQSFREEIPKLFATRSGIVWGVAGSIAIQQELRAALEEAKLERQPARKQARDAITTAVRSAIRQATAAIEQPSLAARTVEGLFAWYSSSEDETFLLRVLASGATEFAVKYSVVGMSGPRELARFGLSQSEHLGYGTLRLPAATMVAFKIADDVIRASATSVGRPVQIAAVTPTRHEVVAAAEVQGVAHTLAAFREHQRDFLDRDETSPSEPDTGIRPS